MGMVFSTFCTTGQALTLGSLGMVGGLFGDEFMVGQTEDYLAFRPSSIVIQLQFLKVTEIILLATTLTNYRS